MSHGIGKKSTMRCLAATAVTIAFLASALPAAAQPLSWNFDNAATMQDGWGQSQDGGAHVGPTGWVASDPFNSTGHLTATDTGGNRLRHPDAAVFDLLLREPATERRPRRQLWGHRGVQPADERESRLRL
jgi:hypothetical protein